MLRTRRVTATLVFALAAGVGVPVLSATPAAAEHSRQRVTLEGHRGARGLRPENTLPAMAIALKTGVDILELDTGVTQDGVVVLSHERRASTLECQDTGPAFAGDPEWPYIGKLWKDLTLTQVKTLDCGRRTPPDPANDPFAGTQEPVPGTRMPTLAEVFELADRYGARGVTFDIETKLDPTRPEETVDPQTFAAKVVGVIAAHGKTRRSVLQSFDWRTLVAARELAPRLKLAALAQQSTIYPGTPWTAGVEVGDAPFEGDLACSSSSGRSTTCRRCRH
jgi:glycerophosphoryl diester phosphodiesterase